MVIAALLVTARSSALARPPLRLWPQPPLLLLRGLATSPAYNTYNIKHRLLDYSATNKEEYPGHSKLKEKQRYYQMDNGQLIHQRGGISNKILYGLTYLFLLACFIDWAQFYWAMLYPPPK